MRQDPVHTEAARQADAGSEAERTDGLGLWFADFHIHIGRAMGRPVKMAAAPSLTLDRLLHHARAVKGLDIVTVIDGVCTGVLAELTRLVQTGELTEQPGGGLRHKNGLVVFPGAEVEIAGPAGGAAHFGAWFPTLAAAADFHAWLATVQGNPALSSQRARVEATALQREVAARQGLFVVHHAFTPHKGLYGCCVRSMADMLEPQLVDAVELGLSADSEMADGLSELAPFTFLTNSDAHSLPKVAREYNALRLAAPTFAEVAKALRREAGRRVAANYGLLPELGKYHRSVCAACGAPWSPGQTVCRCGSRQAVGGVRERLRELSDCDPPRHPPHRPPYIRQVPLAFVPGIGEKWYARLLAAFGTEMDVLHRTSRDALATVCGEALAERIDLARRGLLTVEPGGGGVYGRLRLAQA
ncbi:hypothetical protein GCM10010885_01630 [Alicyclobacillus cellulosilyticus]|uniref:TIGR00375 family protein n=1 Tax=Alicyclobacillus cellulosilyticus TaxID=1003997 RepID=A0A917K054_9BACL|nr:endonuclease Q family protein [Alicyclobacillus cellulosilyticus]GGI95638.1 hypothetical protein GCM10010885_01630 [Alicyclobacillus cellulosilyticus]